MADTLPSVYMTRHMLQQVFISGNVSLFLFFAQGILLNYSGIVFIVKN